MAEPNDRESAATAFISRVVLRSYDGAIDGSTKLLQEGPSGQAPDPDLVRVHRWYQSLTDEDREQVRFAIRDAIDSAVFGFFVLLDGATGGWPMPGKVSDFALYLQMYADEAAGEADQPTTRIKINPLFALDDLHDRYRDFLNDRSQQEGPPK